MLTQLLQTFQRFTGPLAIAEALREAGASDLTDVALLEWFLWKPSVEVGAMVAWVEGWPMLGRWGKPTVAPGDVVPRLDKLVERGLLQKANGYTLTTRALECFPIVLPRGDRKVDVAIDVTDVGARLRMHKAPADAIGESLMKLVDPHDEESIAEIATDVSAIHKASLALAEAILSALTSDAASLAELQAALATLRADLTHPARQMGPTPGSVLRWAVLRFCDNVAPMFDATWLGTDEVPRNDLRCEWLLRSFAAYVGLSVRNGKLQETPLDSVRQLLTVDHRRAQLFADEAEYQKKIVSLADERLKTEKKRRDDAAEAAKKAAEEAAKNPSYAGGRRE